MLRGPQQDLFDLMFRLPAECADLLASGQADIGLVPIFELTRQPLAIVPGVSIASRGAVRSILLVSKKPAREIATLAADSSSRTSVALARILLARWFGANARVLIRPPALEPMLAEADAALIIGDPALRLDPDMPGYYIYDLGTEWTGRTGLPMVFAVWAGRPQAIEPWVVEALQKSCAYGCARLEEIVTAESARLGMPEDLVRQYLTHHIVCDLGPAERAGMDRFLSYVRQLPDEATVAS